MRRKRSAGRTLAHWRLANAATSPSGISTRRLNLCIDGSGAVEMPNWLEIHRGDAPLIVSIPHSGADLLPGMERGLVNPWLARKDTDWHVEKLYDFAPSFGATTIRTAMSRTVIDVNRDPSGKSLYPGQATTELG